MELAAGLVFMTAGMLVVLYGVVEIMSSGCTAPPAAAFGGCWNGFSWYFVVLGAFLFFVGLFWSIVGGFRKGRTTGVPPANPRSVEQ